jgi:hypothetical protein
MEMKMNREDHKNDDQLIDLGAATDETKGPNGGKGDFIGLQDPVGISDD